MSLLAHAPNIPQVADQDVHDPELREVIRKAAVTKSPPQAWYRTMGHNPEVAKAFASYWNYLHRGGSVPHEVKELAAGIQILPDDWLRILRAADLSACCASITEEEKTSCALPNWEHPDPKTRAALHFTPGRSHSTMVGDRQVYVKT